MNLNKYGFDFKKVEKCARYPELRELNLNKNQYEVIMEGLNCEDVDAEHITESCVAKSKYF